MADTSNDNLSIELEENFEGKSNSELLEQLQEITRRIAQSDRNNIIFREIKKPVKIENIDLNQNFNKTQQKDKQQPHTQYKKGISQLRQTKNAFKKQGQKFQLLSKKRDSNRSKEKSIDIKNQAILRQNQRLEKMMSSLQQEYNLISKSNRQKQSQLNQMKAQKEQLNIQNQQSESRVEELKQRCQLTKAQAEKTQAQLKQQKCVSTQLSQILIQKEQLLKERKSKKQDYLKKQEQTDKSIMKMKNTAKLIQKEIDKKMSEMNSLQSVHLQMEKQIERFQHSQKKYEQILIKRSQIISNLRKCNTKIHRQKQANQKILNGSS